MNDYTVFADRERKGWADKSIVGSYVAKFGPVTDQAARSIVGSTPVKDLDVLDLCCGHGALTQLLCNQGARAVGLDFSEEMLAVARRFAPAAAFEQGDAASLPFEDKRFDLVICNFGMMHLPDQPAALAEVARVLRPGGSFRMATWSSPERSPAFGTVFSALKAHADFSAAPSQPDLFTFARPEEAKALMQAAGLTLQDHREAMFSWHLSSPDELFDIFHDATVAAAILIKSQSPETIEKIRQQITSTVRDRFSEGTAFQVPVAVSLLTALV